MLVFEKNEEYKKIKNEIINNDFKSEVIFESTWKFFRVVRFYVFLIIFLSIIQPMFAPSNSMYPIIRVNDFMFFTKSDNIKRGDIISFVNPRDEDELYIKRVVGLPGELIEIIGDKTYINSDLLEEKYIYTKDIYCYYDDKSLKIPEDCYYVLGDNRFNSVDSRSFGTIKKEKIKGKLILNIPLGKIIKTQ